MAEVITMPRLSDTMTDGKVAKWHKKVGDAVKEGDILAEIETDKAVQDFESEYNGTLLYIGTEAVSYTHLDVYKRQVVLSKVNRNSFSFLLSLIHI